MQLKRGDWVLIVGPSSERTRSGFVDSMVRYIGKLVKVRVEGYYFDIKVDGNQYDWRADWVQPLGITDDEAIELLKLNPEL